MATISFTYCMARAGSICRAGPEGSMALAGAGDPCAVGWTNGAGVELATGVLPWLQPRLTTIKMQRNRELQRGQECERALMAWGLSRNHVRTGPKRFQSNLFALLLAPFPASAPLLGMDQPDDTDAPHIEQDHGSSVDGHVHDVGGGRENGRDDKEDQHCAADVLEEEFGVHHAHHAAKSQHDGQFEDKDQAQDDGEKEVGICLSKDHRLEIP